jgi:choline-glycine betaine transporter
MRNRVFVITLVVVVVLVVAVMLFGDRLEHWLLRLHGMG